MSATCDICNLEMTEGGGCTATHLARTARSKAVKRVFFGDEADDWGGPNCHDCNAGKGQPHHMGCDVERCPSCERQLISCDCNWGFLVSPPVPDADPIVKVVWKDEGDFGFITTVRRSEMRGMPDDTPWLEVLADKVKAGGSIGVPYDPNRQRPAGTRAQAKALAREHHAHYEEV